MSVDESDTEVNLLKELYTEEHEKLCEAERREADYVDKINELNADQERAFGVLESHGVSFARANTVSNGIMVLMERIDREHTALEAALASERAKWERESILDRAVKKHGWERIKVLLAIDDPSPAPDATALREAARPIAEAWKRGELFITEFGAKKAVALLGVTIGQLGDLARALLASERAKREAREPVLPDGRTFDQMIHDEYPEDRAALLAAPDATALREALEEFVALYDDDIGMDSFPDATQVEGKSTTFGVLRRARALLATQPRDVTMLREAKEGSV